MRTGPIAAVVSRVGVVGMLLAGGCSSAGTTVGRSTATTVIGSAGDTSSATTNNRQSVHLTAYSDNDGPTSRVVITGAIGDYGEAVSVNQDGSVNPEHNSELGLRLSHGTFTLNVAELETMFVDAVRALPPNAVGCSGTASATDAVPVVAGSGTAKYKGITGTFDLTITLDEVYVPSSCAPTSAFLAQAIVLTGSGSISITS
jgi:hypothetical protein